MDRFDPAAYGPVFSALVSGDRLRALDAGRPDVTVGEQLQIATLKSAFAQARVVDRDAAQACLAGVWLVHDFLDESHAISQRIDSADGSFWHGVMHRRDGDFSNAKYWFRRAGRHAILGPLATEATEVAANGSDPAAAEIASRVAARGEFDPDAFVDACQAAVRTHGAAEAFCRRLQRAEWELLFDSCYRRAIGG